MKQIPKRVVGLTIALLVAGGAQLWLFSYVSADDHSEIAAPTASLSELPRQLGDWSAEDKPVDQQLHFADDHIHRVYQHTKTGQKVTLWVAYSATAADRGHHPQVCMAVLGKPENTQRAALLSVEGHDKPIQRLHFGAPGAAVWTYYWHYALLQSQDGNGGMLRKIYRKTRQLPPSVTLEVFSDDRGPRDLADSQDFVTLVDQALQPLIGPSAKRGNARLPVTIVQGG